MEASQKKKLGEWMRRQMIAVAEEKEAPLARFSVHHTKAGGSKIGVEIGSVTVPAKHGIADVPDLIDELDTILTDDVNGLGGRQRYVIAPHFKGIAKPSARYIITLRADEDDDDEGELDTEGPSKHGLLSQLMRHNEGLMRTHTMGTATLLNAQARMIQTLADQNESLLQKHTDYIVATEELLDRKHERDLEIRRIAYKETHGNEIIQRVLLLLPNVVNRFMGKKALPEKTTPTEQIVRSLIESLKPEQFPKVMEALTPDQQMAILSLVEHIRKTWDEPTAKQNGALQAAPAHVPNIPGLTDQAEGKK